MEIVDSQVHLNRLPSRWHDEPNERLIEMGIVAMDAVGVDAVLIDERSFLVRGGPERDCECLPNGVVRFPSPFGELAVRTHPDRFAYLSRIDRRDPDLRSLMATIRTRPGNLCLRITPIPETGEVEPFARREYNKYFSVAEELGIPVFVHLDGRIDLLLPYLRDFRDLNVIVDHSGLAGQSPSDPAARYSQLEPVLRLADFPNVSLKWAKGLNRISTRGYPYVDLDPLLRSVIDRFGAHRVMWASDATVTTTHHPWAHSLYSILGSEALTWEEKEWVLGRTARAVLRWPAPHSTTLPWLDRAGGPLGR